MHIDKWECCYSQRDTRFCIGVWKKRLQTRFFDSMMDGALATSTPFANNTNKMHMPAQMLCMAIRFVEFSSMGYKIRKIFA